MQGKAAMFLRSDPRLYESRRKLQQQAKHVLGFASAKGGVGKTTLAVLAALHLARMRFRVGLLDLDLTNPCTHLLLGVEPRLDLVGEEAGISPPKIAGIEYMTIAFFTGGKPLPLRGSEATSAILEILAATNWGQLDVLVIDFPPGIKDEILDLSMIGGDNVKIVVVTTPSKLSVEAAKRLIDVARSEKLSILGLVENMADKPGLGKELARQQRIEYLGHIPWDPDLEQSFGRPEKLVEGKAGKAMREVTERLVKLLEG